MSVFIMASHLRFFKTVKFLFLSNLFCDAWIKPRNELSLPVLKEYF